NGWPANAATLTTVAASVAGSTWTETGVGARLPNSPSAPALGPAGESRGSPTPNNNPCSPSLAMGAPGTAGKAPRGGPGAGVEGVDQTVPLVGDQQVAAELAEVGRRQGQAPGRIQRGPLDELLQEDAAW